MTGEPAKLKPVPWPADLEREEGHRLAGDSGHRRARDRSLLPAAYDPARAVLDVAAGTQFSALTLSGASTAITDGMYLVAYLLPGAAGLHPSMAGLSEASRRRQARLGRGGLLAMGAATLVVPALLILQRLRAATSRWPPSQTPGRCCSCS